MALAQEFGRHKAFARDGEREVTTGCLAKARKGGPFDITRSVVATCRLFNPFFELT